jgi:hypothetical protein
MSFSGVRERTSAVHAAIALLANVWANGKLLLPVGAMIATKEIKMTQSQRSTSPK